MRQPQTVVTLAQHWGSAVAKRRALLSLSQAQLAEICGVTQQTISKIESGRMIPHDRLKVVLATRMGTEPSALFVWPQRSALHEGAA